MSSAIAAAGVGRTSIACQCASISPGISVRPLPLTITVLTLRSTGMGEGDMRSILLPRTSTFDGAESVVLLPSKMRTFWNKTTEGEVDWGIAKTAMNTKLSTRAMLPALATGWAGTDDRIDRLAPARHRLTVCERLWGERIGQGIGRRREIEGRRTLLAPIGCKRQLLDYVT